MLTALQVGMDTVIVGLLSLGCLWLLRPRSRPMARRVGPRRPPALIKEVTNCIDTSDRVL